MNKDLAKAFVQDWLDAWNTRDMPRILAHYDDAFEMHSPLIAQMGAKSDGCLRGKPAVAAYWAQALRLHPQVRFELESVLVGVNSLVIQYRLPNARKVAEVMAFNEVGRVVRSHAHYEA